MSRIMPGAEPFYFAGGEVGCLLIHGFTGTPKEMRGLGEYLARQGLTVQGVLLAGHGTTPEDMEKTAWPDWYASARDGLRELQERCRRVFAMGLSMGGVLALRLGAYEDVAGVVAMSTPLFIGDWRLLFLGLVKHFVRFIPQRPADFRDPEAMAHHICYDRYPTRCIESLLALLHRLEDELPQVKVPVLLIHSRLDRGVPPENMPRIYRRLGSQVKRMVWLERSGHVITEDVERETVFRLAYEFVAANV